MFYGKLIKKNGVLEFVKLSDSINHNTFVKNLKEGEKLDLFLDISDDNGSLVQLAKIHACIKALATESGYTVSEMKKIVKRESGLAFSNSKGEFFKSFGDCSSEELSLAVQTCIEIGAEYNMDLT